jgi:hypothetical protein
MCINENYSEVSIGKHLSNKFHIQNGMIQRDILKSVFFNFV